MRRYSKISGMTIVTCDFAHAVRFPGEPRHCLEEFRSGSVKSIIPKQLELAGWTTRTLGPYKDEMRVTQDLCPVHRESSIMERSEKLAAERRLGTAPR